MVARVDTNLRSLMKPVARATPTAGLSLEPMAKPAGRTPGARTTRLHEQAHVGGTGRKSQMRLGGAGAYATADTATRPISRHPAKGAKFAPQHGLRNSPTMGVKGRHAVKAAGARPEHKATQWHKNRAKVSQPSHGARLPKQEGVRKTKPVAKTPEAKQPEVAAQPLGAQDTQGVNAVGKEMLGKLAKLGISREQVESIAKKNGVPLNLMLSVIKQESNGNPNAKSWVGAKGLMQLMPGTARAMGVKNPSNPLQNLEGGAKYLGQMLRQQGGNVQRALAAYNAGPGNVRKYGGIPPFRETRNYVNKIMNWFRN